MKILVDMNLSPKWVSFLEQAGMQAAHWSETGAPDAPDAELMEWARQQAYIILTHDLDFGTLLAHTRHGKPSVVQVRAKRLLPEDQGVLVLATLRAHAEVLQQGALLTLDSQKCRVRILPL